MKLLLLLVACPLLLFSQQKRELRFFPADVASARVCSALKYQREVTDSTEAGTVIKKVIDDVRAGGFLLASVDSICSDQWSVEAVVSVGNRFDRARVRLDSVPGVVLAYAGFSRQKNVSIATYLASRDNIISHYENNGYPFARVVLRDVTVLPDGVEATCVVDPGNRVTVSHVIVKGYTRIPPSFMYQQTGVFPGDEYNEGLVSGINHAVNELLFVEADQPPTVLFDTLNTAHVVIYVKKKQSNTFDGLLGFAPGQNNDTKLVLTGRVSLELNNVLGLGEKLNIDWQKLDRFSQKLETGYAFRYVMGSRLGNELLFSLFKKDTTYLNTDLSFSVPYYLSYNKVVSVFFQNKSSTLVNSSNSVTRVVQSPTGNVTKNMVGAGTKLWYYDSFFNPRRGYLVKVEVSSGKRTEELVVLDSSRVKRLVVSQSPTVELRGQLACYVPLARKVVVYLDNKTALMQSKRLLQNELFVIGGTKTLRGFDEGEIPCSRYSIVTAELRYLYQRNSNVYAFYNAAYYQNKAINTPGMVVQGLGVGLNIQSKSSIFTISYARGISAGNRFLLNKAKIHFGYINTF